MLVCALPQDIITKHKLLKVALLLPLLPPVSLNDKMTRHGHAVAVFATGLS